MGSSLNLLHDRAHIRQIPNFSELFIDQMIECELGRGDSATCRLNASEAAVVRARDIKMQCEETIIYRQMANLPVPVREPFDKLLELVGDFHRDPRLIVDIDWRSIELFHGFEVMSVSVIDILAIDDTGYVSLPARIMVQGRSHSVGMKSKAVSGLFLYDTSLAISSRDYDAGWHPVSLCWSLRHLPTGQDRCAGLCDG